MLKRRGSKTNIKDLYKEPEQKELIKILVKNGIQLTDQRLFDTDLKNNQLVKNAVNGSLVIPAWQDLVNDITEIYNQVKDINKGENASYISQLANVDPDYFAVSVCTIDGQVLEIGDTDIFFTAQSCSKPITYCIAVEENTKYNCENVEKAIKKEITFSGEDYVHNFVGREPSGRNFNELCLNNENIPHNPMINAGSIMAASLINYRDHLSDRYEKVLQYWSKMCGDEKINFSNTVYLSEKTTADRNYCLGYMMQEKNAFKNGTGKFKRDWHSDDLENCLQLYFQSCSIEITCTQMAKIASTFANGGICPFTNKVVFNSDTVKNVLSLMHSCGMYDYSGEWSYLMGIPAKSGVSGVIYAVIPNVMSIAIYSPRLDNIGNSVRGIEFFKRFIKKFNFHVFDSLIVDNNKKSITKRDVYQTEFNKFLFLEAAAHNDVELLRKLLAQNVNVNSIDYDNRTALHIASSNNNIETAIFLLQYGADKTMKDRWGNTPIDDASRLESQDLLKILQES